MPSFAREELTPGRSPASTNWRLCETMHLSRRGAKGCSGMIVRFSGGPEALSFLAREEGENAPHQASLDLANRTPAKIIALSHSLISLRLRKYRATVSGSQVAQAST